MDDGSPRAAGASANATPAGSADSAAAEPPGPPKPPNPPPHPRRAWRRLTAWWSRLGRAVQVAVVAVVVSLVGSIVVPIALAPDPEKPPELRYLVGLPPLLDSCSGAWIVPEAPDGGEDDPVAGEVPDAGTLAAGSAISVHVQEITDRTVFVHGLRARVVSRQAEETGTVLLSRLGCGQVVDPVDMVLDLDEDRPTAAVTEEGLADGSLWTVSQSDPLAYLVRLDVTAGRVDFVLELEWSWGEEHHVTTMDDDGRPFTVSSAHHARPLCFADTWTECT